MIRRLAALAAATALSALALPGAFVPGALGQDRPPRTDDLHMTVEAYRGTIGPEGSMAVGVRIANDGGRTATDLRVLVTVHRKAFHRSDFQQAVDEGRVGNLWGSIAVDVPELEGRRTTVVEVRQSAAELGFGRVTSELSGVYPVRIQLLLAGEVVDERHTSLVVAPADIAEPLRVAIVLPVDIPPPLSSRGDVDASALASEFAPRGRLQRLLTPVEAEPAGVTLAADASLLEAAAHLAGDPEQRLSAQAGTVLERVRRIAALPGVELAALPYASGDLVALVRGGMRSEAARLVSEGQHRTEDLLGERPSRGLLVPADGLDAATLGEVANAGIDTVVLDERYLQIPEGRDLRASPNPVRELRGALGTRLEALVPDPWLSPLLAELEELPGPLAAQRVLAEATVVYFERPFAARPRGLLLTAPSGWSPPPGMLTGLLRGLRQAAWLEPVDLRTLADEVPAEESPVRVSYPPRTRTEELSAEYVATLRSARRSLGSLRGVLSDGSDTPTRFDRMLLAASSVSFRDDPLAGRRLIAAVADRVAELYEAVDIVEGPTVLLSSMEGQIPVTVANDSDVPLTVRVRMITRRYEFDGGPVREVTLEPAASRTIAFRVRALASGGTAPVGVRVEDLDGELLLDESTVVVRSTAVSLTAVAITAGAAIFLLGWWLRLVARRRREAAERTPEPAA